jgi:PAS domain S-box-containing protein
MKRGTKILVVAIAMALLAIGASLPFILPTNSQTLDERRASVFDKEELALLRSLSDSSTPIRIGHIPDTPPIDFRAEDASIRDGITWSYVEHISDNLGIHFQRVKCDTWEQALESRRIDLIGSIQQTTERQEKFEFSESYLTVRMFILARKDSKEPLSLENMKGQTLAVVKGTAIESDLENKKRSEPAKYGYILVPVNSTRDGIRQVAAGEISALVADGAASSYYMSQLGISLRAGETDYAWDLRFASHTNSPLSMELIDKALGMISKKERRAIENQWPTLLNTVPVDLKLLLRSVGGMFILTLLSIGGVILWNRTLRKQLTDHLRELGRVRMSHAQATKALDESEERFRVLVESSNDIIWETDRYGSYTYISPRVRDVLGYMPEELAGKSSVSLMIPTDSARKMVQLRQRTVGSTIDCEINTYLHKDGRKVILESSGMAYADNTGELAGFRGVSRDITDRITNENALRRSEERFRNLVETTSDWIWEVDTEGFYNYLSPQSAELLGYQPDELMGRHFTSLMPDREAERLKLFFSRISETGKPIHSLVTNNRHREGRSIVLETSAVPFYDEEWQIQGFRGISRDITERVAAERKLEFERNLFRYFMEHAPDLIYFKDAKGRFIEVNTAKAEELRRPTEDIIGKTDYDFFPEHQARQMSEDEAEVMRTRKPLQKEELTTTPDGDRWYLTTKVPRYDEDGNVVGTFGTSWDITFRKQADEERRQLRVLLSNTIDSMPSMLVGVDADGCIIQWNRLAESASGLAASEALGMHLRNAFPELAKEMVKVERAIRERKPQTEERIRAERDQHVRYHDITVFPLEGDTAGAVIRVDDVTDRVMIEDSIRNIVEGVAAVGRRFFSSMVMQLCKTLDADFTYISEFVDDDSTTMRTIAVSDTGNMAENFEYELAATPCCRVMTESRCVHVANVREHYPDTVLLQTHEIVSYIGIPLVDSENKPLGIMVAMYKDPIEEVEFASSIMQVFAGRTAAELERLQATKELIALQDLLRNIIDSMPSILIGVDADGRVMQWNREAEKSSGLEASRAHGQPLSNVFAQLSPDLDDVFKHLLKKGPQHHERIQCTLKGDQHIVDVTVYPITAEGAEGAVIRLDDVTDRVRIEEMMVQSEKMMSVGGLAAGMAHEINNPLAGILQNMQVIRNRIMHNTDRNLEVAETAGTSLEAVQHYMQSRGLIKMLDSTAEAGHRAAKIVDNMLSFSRKDESHFAPHNLEEIIERSIELASNDYNLKKRFDFRHIRILRDFDELPPVPCEASQIQQVLLNLLSNSAQAMAGHRDSIAEPQITIRLKNGPETALIEVEDNGPGMDDDTRKRAFEPFFTTKEVGHGTGLGLSVSFFIVTENHGGTMRLDSSPGKGARFSIRLPYEHRTELWGLRL